MRTISSILIALIVLFIGCASHRTALKAGERIVFLGDSITQLGVKPNGYVTLISDHFAAQYADLNIGVIGAGISGNKVTDLQQRLDSDVLAKKPTIVVIYIGINDVWHWALKNNGTPKDQYEEGLKDMIGKIESQGAHVILCTPTVIGEKYDGTNPQDAMLDEYADISRHVAQKLDIELCDLRSMFVSYLKTNNPQNQEKDILTYDRVHLNDRGNQLVAESMLRVLIK